MDQSTFEYLSTRYEASKRYQTSKGIRFDLTMDEFVQLWERKRYLLRKTSNTVKSGTVERFMKSDDGIVCSWKCKTDREGGVMNAQNADITVRTASIKRFRLQKGEKHREDSKQKISASKTGKAQTDSHVAKRAAALTGRTQSDASNEKRRQAAKARWDRKRAEQATQQQEPIMTPTEIKQNEQLIVVARQLEEATKGVNHCIEEWRAFRGTVIAGNGQYSTYRAIMARKHKYEERRDLAAHLIAAHERGECMVMARLQWTRGSE